MASLLAKDAYLQGLARKICARPGPEPRERRRGIAAAKARVSGAAGHPTKKRKKAQKSRERREKAARPQAPSPGQEASATSGARTAAAAQRDASPSAGAPAGGATSEPQSLFALDVLRERLHEKIQQARGQDQKELSAAALEKRRRRKQERERKKRKQKELRAREKEKAAGPQAPVGASTPPAAPDAPGQEVQGGSGLLFNKVEVGSDEPPSKAQRRKEKRAQLKGKLTPLTGRNYRQLLERLQARRERVEELRERDAGRAQELQARMQWTNLLYKAEGVKIRDDEQRLQEALKRKRQRRAQRERKWQSRTARVVQGMQQRQERRRQSLRRMKAARTARRLDKARKKGRVLPQDLERAGLV